MDDGHRRLPLADALFVVTQWGPIPAPSSRHVLFSTASILHSCNRPGLFSQGGIAATLVQARRPYLALCGYCVYILFPVPAL